MLVEESKHLDWTQVISRIRKGLEAKLQEVYSRMTFHDHRGPADLRLTLRQLAPMMYLVLSSTLWSQYLAGHYTGTWLAICVKATQFNELHALYINASGCLVCQELRKCTFNSRIMVHKPNTALTHLSTFKCTVELGVQERCYTTFAS